MKNKLCLYFTSGNWGLVILETAQQTILPHQKEAHISLSARGKLFLSFVYLKFSPWYTPLPQRYDGLHFCYLGVVKAENTILEDYHDLFANYIPPKASSSVDMDFSEPSILFLAHPSQTAIKYHSAAHSPLPCPSGMGRRIKRNGKTHGFGQKV